jgi:glycine hydroxymethyltransferase
VREIVAIAEEVGADVLYDGAHVAGLIAGGEFQAPLAEGAAVLTGSTQKTFPGPVGGIVVSRDVATAERIRRVTRARLDNYQNNRIAALGYVFAEMLAFGSVLARSIVESARTLAKALAAEGLSVVGERLGYTASHMVLVDTSEVVGDAGARLEAIGLLVTATEIWPDRPGAPARPCLRFGANEIARLGFDVQSLCELASTIAQALRGCEPEIGLRQRVERLIHSHRSVPRRFLLD